MSLESEGASYVGSLFALLGLKGILPTSDERIP